MAKSQQVKNEIKVILFDLDDTLVKTHDVFVSVIVPLKLYLSEKLGVDTKEFDDYFEAAIVTSHYEVKVNHIKLWTGVLRIIKEKYQITDEIYNYCWDKLMSIYDTVPELFEDTLSTLKALSDKGYQLGIVTHSKADWTEMKLEKTGIKKFFQYVQLVSVDKFKLSEDWAEAPRNLQIPADQIAVVGDNVKGDVQSALEVGYKEVFWLCRKSSWSEYRSGEIPKVAKTINNLSDLLDYL